MHAVQYEFQVAADWIVHYDSFLFNLFVTSFIRDIKFWRIFWFLTCGYCENPELYPELLGCMAGDGKGGVTFWYPGWRGGYPQPNDLETLDIWGTEEIGGGLLAAEHVSKQEKKVKISFL